MIQNYNKIIKKRNNLEGEYQLDNLSNVDKMYLKRNMSKFNINENDKMVEFESKINSTLNNGVTTLM